MDANAVCIGFSFVKCIFSEWTKLKKMFPAKRSTSFQEDPIENFSVNTKLLISLTACFIY